MQGSQILQIRNPISFSHHIFFTQIRFWAICEIWRSVTASDRSGASILVPCEPWCYLTSGGRSDSIPSSQGFGMSLSSAYLLPG